MGIKFSIIIATYNAGKYLERAITSVIANKYNNIDLIIIDANSKDETINIIKKYEQYLSYWVSEKDEGIYDAWNKGVKKAAGDWIMFFGADDILLPNALVDYDSFIRSLKEEVDYISSKKQMIDKTNKLIRVIGSKWEWPFFLKEMMVAHPGSLHSKTLFEKYGLYDTSYKITGDYELLLRPGNKLKAAFMDKITIMMSEGGASDSIMAVKEHYRAALKTGGQSRVSAQINFIIVYLKFKLKKLLRYFGINAYLKK